MDVQHLEVVYPLNMCPMEGPTFFKFFHSFWMRSESRVGILIFRHQFANDKSHVAVIAVPIHLQNSSMVDWFYWDHVPSPSQHIQTAEVAVSGDAMSASSRAPELWAQSGTRTPGIFEFVWDIVNANIMRIMKTMGLWLFDHWQQHFLEHLGDYVPSGNGLCSPGKKMSLASSQRRRKNSLRQLVERQALRDWRVSRVVGWGFNQGWN